MSGLATTLLAGTALLSSMALTFVPAGMFHPAAVAAGPAIAVDATGSGSASSVSSFTASITTVAANTILLAWIGNVTGASPPTVSSVTATGLTFTKRFGVNFTGNVSNGIDYELWWAKVATPGSYTVTANSSSFLNGTMGLVSYKNVNQTVPFDPNFTLPGQNTNQVPFGTNTAVTTPLEATCNPGSFLVGGSLNGLAGAFSVGVNGETQDLKFSSQNIEHIANSTGTFNLRAITWNATNNYWATIADALQPAFPASAIFIDATAAGAMSTASSVTATFTTHVANAVILAWVTNLGATAASSVSGGSLTWTKRQGNPDSTSGGTAQNQELWWAVKPSTGSITVTATWGSSQSNAKVNLVSYGNVNTVTPFDTNGSLPAVNNHNNGVAANMTTASVSTSINGSMLVGGFNVAGGNAYYPGTAGEVFDVSDQSNNSPVEHLATTTTFSSKAITFAYSSPSGGTATNWVSIVDALQPVFTGFGIHSIGQNFTGFSTTTTFSDTITTTVPNCLILAFAVDNSTGGFENETVSGGGLTWTMRSEQRYTTPGVYGNTIEVWWAIAASAGSYTITNTATGATSGSFNTMRLFAISGADTLTPFDMANPTSVQASGSSGSLPTVNISTNNANDLLLGFVTAPSGGISTTPATGWTVVGTASTSQLIEQKSVTATQSSTAVSASANATQAWGVIADAIRQAGSATFGNDGNALLLLHCDGSNGSTTFTDSSMWLNTFNVFGTVQLDTSTQEFGTASLKSDGTSTNRLETVNTTLFNPGSGDFTLDFWLNVASLSLTYYLATKINTATGYGAYLIATGGASKNQVHVDIGTTGTSWDIASDVNIGTFTANTWHHVAIVRHGSTFTGYFDGVGTSLGTSSGALYNSTTALALAGLTGSGGPLNGHMDEIRYSSVARWTANFTPPTSPYS